MKLDRCPAGYVIDFKYSIKCFFIKNPARPYLNPPWGLQSKLWSPTFRACKFRLTVFKSSRSNLAKYLHIVQYCSIVISSPIMTSMELLSSASVEDSLSRLMVRSCVKATFAQSLSLKRIMHSLGPKLWAAALSGLLSRPSSLSNLETAS